VTSDGSAEDELTIYTALGSMDMDRHRVVGCLALYFDDGCFYNQSGNLPQLDKSKESVQCDKGIVMKRLPHHLIDLALPPTIQEVTRDRYGNRTFTETFAYNLLKDIATAITYLHNQIGIAHGDLYAHNIKVDLDGRAFLLDLGASYLLSPYPQFIDNAKRFEMRAFCLLSQELLGRVAESFSLYSIMFENLRKACDDRSQSINLMAIFEI
jgi:serine/threonine protein kinase